MQPESWYKKEWYSQWILLIKYLFNYVVECEKINYNLFYTEKWDHGPIMHTKLLFVNVYDWKNGTNNLWYEDKLHEKPKMRTNILPFYFVFFREYTFEKRYVSLSMTCEYFLQYSTQTIMPSSICRSAIGR